jgi:hypothetical protein
MKHFETRLTEEDIGKHFEIYGRDVDYMGNGILSEVHEENRDYVNRYWRYKFQPYIDIYTEDQEPRDDREFNAHNNNFL